MKPVNDLIVKYRLLLFVFLFFICLPQPCSGQASANDNNTLTLSETQCFVHLNKAFYVSGETIYYKLYFPKNFVGERTVVAATLYNKDNKQIDRSYVRMEADRTVNGFYKIPFEWVADMYRLVFSITEQLETRNIILAEAAIPVYNDFDEKISNAISQEPQAKVSPKNTITSDIPLRINLNTDKSIYNYRDKTKLKIKVSNSQGEGVKAQLSLSVNDAQLTTTDGTPYQNIFIGAPWNPHLVADSIVVYKGELKEIKKEKKLFYNLLMAYLPGVEQAVYSQTDELGNFLMLVPPFYDDKVVQFLDNDGRQVEVELDQLQPGDSSLPSLSYNETILNYLELSAKRKKIYQLYGALENVATVKENPKPKSTVQPDWYFRLDEYESFEDIPTFFKEVLAPLKFRNNKKKGFYARMYDPTQPIRKFYEGDPIFIIDDQITIDVDYVRKIDIAKVEQIDLYFVFDKLRTRFGPLGYNGVVMIHSRNKDLEVPNSSQSGKLVLNGFQSPLNYPIKINTASDIPQLSPNLYWSPVLETDENGVLEIEIPNGSDNSTFLIDLVAQDGEGNMGRAQNTYELRRSTN